MEERTILVVEDDPDHRKINATILRHRGFRVLEAGDGEEAIRQVAQGRPDAVVMDASLPKLDGWKATERLKSDPATRGIPVLMLTARVMDAEKERTARAGCDGFLEKPCDPRTMVAEVERLLAARSGGPAAE
jgi:CheY-like chemotaxis protein